MPDTITVDKVIGHNIYANGSVNAYGSDYTTVKKTFSNGQLIGNVYSWVVHDGDVWYLIYLSDYDFNNFIPTLVKHDSSKISLPDLPGIIQEIQDKADQEKRDRLGVIPYYIEKYMPWIVGGVVVAVAAPALLRSGSKNVSGMTQDQKNLTGLAITGVVVYLLTRKHTKAGPLIIGDPYDGTFPDPVTGELPPLTQGTNSTGSGTTGSGTISVPGTSQQQLISYIGPFPVGYKTGNGIIAGVH